MNYYHGQDGLVKINDDASLPLKSWSLNLTANTQACNVLGQSWTQHVATQKTWTASLNAYLDETQLNTSSVLQVGDTVQLQCYPTAPVRVSPFAGDGIITSVDISTQVDNLIEVTLSVQGTGPLTLASVAQSAKTKPSQKNE